LVPFSLKNSDLADRIVVMKDGRIVEQGTAAQVVENPSHPYTRSLIEAAPIPDPDLQRIRRETAGFRLGALQGTGANNKEGPIA
jgi:ABC-type dipeptide/oligopeptide/nickel transport system ATPase component